jgi:hypothetical protein
VVDTRMGEAGRREACPTEAPIRSLHGPRVPVGGGEVGHRRGGAGVGGRRHRRDGRRDRAADDRADDARPARHVAVGGVGLPPDAGCVPAARRIARGPARAGPRVRHRGHLVRARLGGLRPRPERAPPRRGTRAAGRGRGTADPGQPRDPPGFLPARGPAARHRRVVGPRRAGHRRRSAARRLVDLGGLVAVGVLHQRARRRGGAVDRAPPRPPSRAIPTRPDRSTSVAPCWPSCG